MKSIGNSLPSVSKSLLQWVLVGSLILNWLPVDAQSANSIRPASVESVPASSIPETSLLRLIVRDMVFATCNIGKIPEGKVTAMHCFSPRRKVSDIFHSKDIIIAQSLSQKVQEIVPWSSVRFTVNREPEVVQVSTMSYSKILWDILQARWCLPDSAAQRIYCYTITGWIRQDTELPRGVVTMRLQKNDIKNIAARRWWDWDLSWISWAPVFDSAGKFVWVISMQSIEDPFIHIQLHPSIR